MSAIGLTGNGATCQALRRSVFIEEQRFTAHGAVHDDADSPHRDMDAPL
jgi:hypothetical protein